MGEARTKCKKCGEWATVLINKQKLCHKHTLDFLRAVGKADKGSNP